MPPCKMHGVGIHTSGGQMWGPGELVAVAAVKCKWRLCKMVEAIVVGWWLVGGGDGVNRVWGVGGCSSHCIMLHRTNQ